MTDTPTNEERESDFLEADIRNALWAHDHAFGDIPKYATLRKELLKIGKAALERVRLDERERCAQIAESLVIDNEASRRDALAKAIYKSSNDTLTVAAKAIRDAS